MTDPRSLRRPRQIVVLAQSLSLLSIVSQLTVHRWSLTLTLSALSALVVVAVVVSRPVAGPTLRWLTGLSAAGLAGALFSLWLIRDEPAAIPLGQVGGLFLSLVVTIVTMTVLGGRTRKPGSATT